MSVSSLNPSDDQIEDHALVKPFHRMNFVALQGSGVGVYTRELHVVAEVVSAVEAEEATPTWHSWLDGYTITCSKVSYPEFPFALPVVVPG